MITSQGEALEFEGVRAPLHLRPIGLRPIASAKARFPVVEPFDREPTYLRCRREDMFCPNCGVPDEVLSGFCRHCGQGLTAVRLAFDGKLEESLQQLKS